MYERVPRLTLKVFMRRFGVALSAAVVVLATYIVIRDWMAGIPVFARTSPCRCGLAREDFINDLDHLLAVTRNEFPYLGLVYRRNGADLLERGEAVRKRLANGTGFISCQMFWEMLRDHFFFYAHPVGHFRLIDTRERQIRLRAGTMSPRNMDVLGTPPVCPVRSTRGRVVLGNPEVSNFNNLITDIIEENHIAYVRVRSFPYNITFEERQLIREFYEEIAGFEHLIIDIRSGGGGWVSYFDELIAGPLVRSPLRLHYYNFYINSEHTAAHIQDVGMFIPASRAFCIEDNMLGAASLNLTDGVIEDLSHFDYHFVSCHTVNPLPLLQSGFDGKIWMLIDEYVFSGGEWVARFYKNTGFATLVGNTSGGMVGHMWGANYIALPNTGFIFRYDAIYTLDNNGRPMEYGTEPHFFNFPGMDALETTLELIRTM